jgi:hypothetical protein
MAHPSNATEATDASAATPKLRCLPYYYMLGDFNCGQRDLHSRLLQARKRERERKRVCVREREGFEPTLTRSTSLLRACVRSTRTWRRPATARPIGGMRTSPGPSTHPFSRGACTRVRSCALTATSR